MRCGGERFPVYQVKKKAGKGGGGGGTVNGLEEYGVFAQHY